MFSKVLIANRGAIATRILRTLKRLDVRSVVVYSDADREAAYVAQADEAIHIGPAAASESYLNQERIIAAARAAGAEAIHPGYGFLSENAAFAERCEAAGIVFIGPTPKQMRNFGLKHTARELALACDVPLLPGSGLLEGAEHAVREAERIGYPAMLKSTAGGGGIGMQMCRDARELRETFASVERLAKANFSQGGLFLEKFVEYARHIEVQIFGDGQGNVVALGERDCSLQRRNQKVIEETPAPGLDESTRAALLLAAKRLGASVAYRSAGTVEFVYDTKTGAFYFLEVNTRLQVEHGVTEEVTGIDLVEWMIRTAAGEPPSLSVFEPRASGHAVQARVYAEDAAKSFRPSSGRLTHVEFPRDVRVDAWIETGTEVSPHYDPMLAKIICRGKTRSEAIENLRRALERTRVDGIETNLEYLRTLMSDAVFRDGVHYTRYLATLSFCPATIEVLDPGTHSMVVDYPGRIGFWNIGVPPSGPMDDRALRAANQLVGNPEDAAGLELTVSGPTLKFNVAATVALTGAHMRAELDGERVAYWKAFSVAAGSVLKIRGIEGAGQRAYLAIRGGFDVPRYMGSRTTFTLGQFGGHAGRVLRVGDVLRVDKAAGLAPASAIDAPLVPQYSSEWEIAVLYGPHGAPEFFTAEDIEAFFSAAWEVHYNSSRTGVRLIGPKPRWARSDGGEAGLHPSNIHDNAYAIGSIDFTGDMPVILGPDGPSLGGFVCPATIVAEDLWKIGQLRPGDKVRFMRASNAPAVLATSAAKDDRPEVCYRQAGDRYLLVEYGPPVLDLNLRFRVHALMRSLEDAAVPGIEELTPGIRSLQVHYDPAQLSQRALLDRLKAVERDLPAIDDMVVPSRIVHLPLSWDDPATRLAIEKYTQSVRKDAPWCPSNIEFIRRINGLDSGEEVRRIVFDASYLVMGLGDVYLGAPVATPLDPRHRLVTTKYNPARTWTPENAVGIGGAYLCVYGMEGPGGYQFVGRTVQMWNRYRQTRDFLDGKQWLLRFFDQIRFYPVSAAELLEMRADFVAGRCKLRVEETELDLRSYREFLRTNAASIGQFKSRQQQAFEEERERWRANGQLTFDSEPAERASARSDAVIPEGCSAITSPVTGNVWQLKVEKGSRIASGEVTVILEAMKMEIAVEASDAGEVIEVRCEEGRPVNAGDVLMVIRP